MTEAERLATAICRVPYIKWASKKRHRLPGADRCDRREIADLASVGIEGSAGSSCVLHGARRVMMSCAMLSWLYTHLQRLAGE